MTDQTKELQRAIAETLGWRIEKRKLSHSGNLEWYVVITPSGEVFETEDGVLPRQLDYENAQLMWHWCGAWPCDLDDALALCLEIAKTLLHSANIEVSEEEDSPVSMRFDAVFTRQSSYDVDIDNKMLYIMRHLEAGVGATPAEALARLALAALQAQEKE